MTSDEFRATVEARFRSAGCIYDYTEQVEDIVADFMMAVRHEREEIISLARGYRAANGVGECVSDCIVALMDAIRSRGAA